MTYINHHANGFMFGHAPDDRDVVVDWRAFTDARLRWLYGPDHKITRAALTASDLAAWRSLGSRTGEAA